MLNFPKDPADLLKWTWSDIEPFYSRLAAQDVTALNVETWLSDWSRVSEFVSEMYNRFYVATTVDTSDKESENGFNRFLDEIYPESMKIEQGLKEKLLASGLEPVGFEIPLRNMRAEVDLFCAGNLPLLSEEQKLANEYDRIAGAQTVEWEGKECTVAQLQPVLQETDRARREQAWRISAERQLADRDAFNALWQKLLGLRLRLAGNAGRPDYRAYRWQQLLRFDYMPEDAYHFQQAIEKVVVPAARRIYDRRKKRLGVDTLRPWDLAVDPLGRPPLRPFGDVKELKQGISRIFHRVDPQLGGYFDIMVKENLLDLDNRKNKAPGGYCVEFEQVRRPFIFTNAVGTHEDVQTLLHEGGHSFHVFELAILPYHAQLVVPMEFAEVASMGMELLASPYLAKDQGGFYDPPEAARARIEHLEESILFWPYMAVVDAFQHWVYENPGYAVIPERCDEVWAMLWQRFIPGLDWSGLEEVVKTGWQRKLHIFQVPFYYIEYGLALLGAVQVWANALNDQPAAVAAYRQALSMGGTATLPQLFEKAGARLAFDEDILRMAVGLMESVAQQLEDRY